MHFYGKFYCNASFNVGCYHVTMGVVFHKIAPKSRIWLLSPSVLLLKHSRWASLLIWLFRWPSERTEGPSMRVSDLGTCTSPSQAIRENWRALEVGVSPKELLVLLSSYKVDLEGPRGGCQLWESSETPLRPSGRPGGSLR